MKTNKSILMKAACSALLAFALLPPVLGGAAAADLKFDKDFPAELLLSPEIFGMYKIKSALDSFEKLPGEGFLIGAGGHVISTELWSSLLKEPYGGLRSFRLLPDGTLLAVTSRKRKGGPVGYLAYLEDGLLLEKARIPGPEMKIAVSADPGEFYLYGGTAAPGVVYRFKPKEKYEVAVKVTGAVGALAGDLKNGLYLGINDEIYELSPGAKPRFMARLRGKKIESLAYDPAGGGCLFASAKDTVIMLRPDSVRTVLTGMGGTLRLRDGKLYIFDRRKKLLVQADYSGFCGQEPAAKTGAPAAAADDGEEESK